MRDQLGFELLSSISGVDMVDHLEAIYHLRSFARRQILQLGVGLDSEKPEVDSIVSVWPTANWHEREMYDLFGIRVIGTLIYGAFCSMTTLMGILCSKASTRCLSRARTRPPRK